jgi:DNA polymerase-1
MGDHVRPDPVMRKNIRPCAQIHDAGYALVKDDMPTVLFMNKHLVDAVNWQDHDDIRHPDVGLGGDLSLFYPTWADEMIIPNDATEEEIRGLIQDHLYPPEKAA